MYRVLIVDDEKIVRLALKNMIEFESMNLELIGEASEGREALDIIRSRQVDILITDLIMPVMSGLDLIDALNEINFEGKILVLSNHDDFDLVKQALKSGASDYLLKGTMEVKELKHTVKKLCEILDDEKKEKEISEKRSVEINRGKRLYRNKVLRALLLDKSIMEKNMFEIFDKHTYRISTGENQVFLIQIDSLPNSIKSNHVSDVEQMVFNIKSIISESIRNRFEGEVVDLNDHEFILIAPSNLVTFPENLAMKIIKKLNMYINQTVSIALQKSMAKNLANDIIRMRSLSIYKFYYGENKVIDLDELKISHDVMIEYEQVLMKAKGMVYDEDYAKIYDLIDKMLIEGERRGYSPDVIKNATVILIRHVINVRNLDISSQYRNKFKAIKQSIFKKEFLDHISDFLQLIKNDKDLRNNRDHVIDKIEYYINVHLNEKITLKDLSQYVHLNASYLSRFFKQVKGESLIEYVNKLKINQAKYLLNNEELSIEEVGRRIGIDDPHYFNKVFKKSEGISPSSYRKKLK